MFGWLFLFVEAIMWNSIFPTLFHRFGYAWYAEKRPYVIVNYLNRSTQMFITAIPLNWINIFSLTNNIGKVISVQTHFSKFGQLLTQKLMTESVWINLRTNGNWIPERKILLALLVMETDRHLPDIWHAIWPKTGGSHLNNKKKGMNIFFL